MANGKRMNEAAVNRNVGLPRRMIAYLIDWYVGGLATALPVSFVSMKLFGSMANQNIMDFGALSMATGALALLCAVLYYWAVPAVVWKGQTLGKRIFRIQIVSDDGGEATPGLLAKRQILGIIVVEGSLVTASTIWHQMASLATGVNLVTPLMYLGMGISLVSAVLVLVGKHKAIHDFLGGSRVVVLDKPIK